MRWSDSRSKGDASASDFDARPVVEALLADAVKREASDIHLEPYRDRYDLRLRLDGVLETTQSFTAQEGAAIVNALMVMAQLLTYRQDVPQEGRLQIQASGKASAGGQATQGEPTVAVRLSVMPTTRGLKAVLRLPSGMGRSQRLDELNLASDVLAHLQAYLEATAGVLLVVGPAGSGKTTTLYALLRELVESQPGLSVVALEDPVEHELEGVTQIEVSAFGELTYERALRSMVRQDPQVLMLGEIRDASTATLALQAALSGHRLVSTMHAGTPGEALARLLEMGAEPYQVTGAIAGVLAMRLVRQVDDKPGKYRGRAPIAAFAAMSPRLREQVLARADAQALDAVIADEQGATLKAAGQAMLDRGQTDATELARVLGGTWQSSQPTAHDSDA